MLECKRLDDIVTPHLDGNFNAQNFFTVLGKQSGTPAELPFRPTMRTGLMLSQPRTRRRLCEASIACTISPSKQSNWSFNLLNFSSISLNFWWTVLKASRISIWTASNLPDISVWTASNFSYISAWTTSNLSCISDLRARICWLVLMRCWSASYCFCSSML